MGGLKKIRKHAAAVWCFSNKSKTNQIYFSILDRYQFASFIEKIFLFIAKLVSFIFPSKLSKLNVKCYLNETNNFVLLELSWPRRFLVEGLYRSKW